MRRGRRGRQPVSPTQRRRVSLPARGKTAPLTLALRPVSRCRSVGHASVCVSVCWEGGHVRAVDASLLGGCLILCRPLCCKGGANKQSTVRDQCHALPRTAVYRGAGFLLAWVCVSRHDTFCTGGEVLKKWQPHKPLAPRCEGGTGDCRMRQG